MKAVVKHIKDDLGSTVDSEDNVVRMILIEQAVDAALEIEEPVSRSYAISDCILAILDFARETSNEALMARVETLLEEITNKGAQARTLSYIAVVLASFGQEIEAEKSITKAIQIASEIKDDFDRRDAFLDIATSAGDIFYLTTDEGQLEDALQFADQLTKGQRAYLFGYLASLLPRQKGAELLKEALKIADEITDPITRSKVYLELANLTNNLQDEPSL